MNATMRCGLCAGTGAVLDADPETGYGPFEETCPDCVGAGVVSVPVAPKVEPAILEDIEF